jgi:hypothetical protein
MPGLGISRVPSTADIILSPPSFLLFWIVSIDFRPEKMMNTLFITVTLFSFGLASDIWAKRAVAFTPVSILGVYFGSAYTNIFIEYSMLLSGDF